MKQLIVNADDYGMAVGINTGIIDAHRRGILTSTTVVATGSALADGLPRLRETPGLDTGCHVLLVGGTPAASAADVRSLVDASGRFARTLTQFVGRVSTGGMKPAELAVEIRAQLDRLLHAGVPVSHCDSHKHTHAHPRVLEVLLRVAEEYKIPYVRNPFERYAPRRLFDRSTRGRRIKTCRRFLLGRILNGYHHSFQTRLRAATVKCPDHFHGFVDTGALSEESLPALLDGIAEGVNELMCHPAHATADLIASPTRLKAARELELAGLVCAQAREAIRRLGIELTSFRKLAGR